MPLGRRTLLFIALFVLGGGRVLAAQSESPATRSATPVLGPSTSNPVHSAASSLRPAQGPPTAAEINSSQDPERRSPGLARRHRALVAARPGYQHLPYRDHEIGADVVGTADHGRLLLLVTYIHTRARARLHLERFLHRHHDPGRGYSVRYRRLFGRF